MTGHSTARGRGLALAALAACATSPTAAQAASSAPSVPSPSTHPNGSEGSTPGVRRSGSYRPASEDMAKSGSKHVTVRASLAAHVTRHVVGGREARVSGVLLPRLAGRAVRLELHLGDGRWSTVERTRTDRGGHYRAAWRPPRVGTYRLRVRFAGDRLASPATGRLTRVYAYRPGWASWYGPGLFGNPLGCGGTLTAGTLGVAHRTLPCGTKVTLRYRGRSATVRVVDRGPYAAGREWDLTAATKQRLDFGSTGTVWSTR